jgi:molybdenum cofactor synthesis domain-containing protein
LSLRVAVLTISDSVAAGRVRDGSGPAVAERCRALGWQVRHAEVLADDEAAIRARLVALADSGAYDLILTTGGTGIGPRDVTPEATAAVCGKLLPGFGERMRAAGFASTPRALLSRAVAGTRVVAGAGSAAGTSGAVLIVNLPGSPKGAVESLDAVAALLPHAVAVLHGARHE